MAKKSFFVAGTDTGVGKTFIACSLLKAAQAKGLSTAAIKPVAAGCEDIDGQWQNEDARNLMQAMTCELDYDVVNPVALEPAIAPHIAAQQVNKNITVARLHGYCRGTLLRAGEFNLIEGAGGWRVPLNNRETLADLAKELQFPVILVVGMRLGCINHTLLTVEAILHDGLTIAGWVANCLEPDMPELAANIDSLKRRLAFPLLGQVNHCHGPDRDSCWQQGAMDLDIEPLFA